MDKQSKVDEFKSVTGVGTERANFYLESSGWNVEVAMSSFYDDDQDDEPEILEPETEAPVVQPRAAASGSRERQTRSSRSAVGIHTLQAMTGEPSDSDEEEGQAFFAGGSEQSGQQILGPRRSRKNGEEIVKQMFKAAKDHGAEEVAADADRDPSQRRSQRMTFVGTGYRLGATPEEATSVPGAPPAPPRPRTVKLRLWRTGFSVDDGQLREFSDPENHQFLDDIRAGHIPRELIRESRGQEVHLDMEDHRNEDYVKPKVKLQSFSGAGHTLGSPTPGIVSGDTAVTGGGASDPAECETAATAGLRLNPDEPVTSVQVRLADGSRIVVKLNHTHTVAQLRQYIVTARPQYATGSFSLRTAFPNKELTDESVSMKDGQLLNAAVMVRPN